MTHYKKAFTFSCVLLILKLKPVDVSKCEYVFTSEETKEGTFNSPDYPNSYAPNLNCRYFFQGTLDERIKISFEKFELEEGTNAGCHLDYIDIFTIDLYNMKHFEDRVCDNKIPKPFISIHQKVEVIFKSDYTIQNYHGFLGKYEFVPEKWQPFLHSVDYCGPGFLTGVGGQIVSPHYPDPYPANVECTWMIKTDYSKRILLTFEEIDLGRNVHCGGTYVSIYNGFASKQGTPTEKVCGQLYFFKDSVKEIKSHSFRVVVRFKSDMLNEYKSHGFKLSWTAVSLPKWYEDQHGNIIDDPCHGFHCKGGEYCIDTSGLLCNPLPRYCIDSSLRCNSAPNCGAYDASDEEICPKDILLVVASVLGPIIMISAIVGAICFCRCKKTKRVSRSRSRNVPHPNVTLERLDRSPSLKRRGRNDYSLSPRHTRNSYNDAQNIPLNPGEGQFRHSPLHISDTYKDIQNVPFTGNYNGLDYVDTAEPLSNYLQKDNTNCDNYHYSTLDGRTKTLRPSETIGVNRNFGTVNHFPSTDKGYFTLDPHRNTFNSNSPNKMLADSCHPSPSISLKTAPSGSPTPRVPSYVHPHCQALVTNSKSKSATV